MKYSWDDDTGLKADAFLDRDAWLQEIQFRGQEFLNDEKIS